MIPESGGLPLRLAAIAAVVIVALLSLTPLHPPPASDAEVGPERFSAERAMTHVRALATAPRAPGSAAHHDARDYIVERMRAAGLEAELQTRPAVTIDPRGRVRSLTPVNVLARFEGSGGGDQAILLVAHYDTVRESPGAGDDAAAVAALLEAARALATGPAPRHDVVFLFSDLEEDGNTGAAVFAEHHPWMEDVTLVLNFEARGSRGPSLLFETGIGSGSGVGELAAATPAVGSSFSADVYRVLPYGSDFAVFRGAGKSGYNFAFIGDRTTYHAPTDVPERLSADSLQHHGVYALELARRFGDELPPTGGDAVYFNLPFLGLVAYPTGVATLLGLLTALAVLAVLVLAVTRGTLRPGRTLVAFLLLLAAWVAVAAVAFTLGALATSLSGGEADTFGDGTGYTAAWALLAAALVFAFAALAARRSGELSAPLIGAVLLLWALLTAVTALLLPASSYLATWPCLALLAATAADLLGRGADRRPAAGRLLSLLAAAALALLLWVPAIHLFALALSASDVLLVALVAACAATLLAPFWIAVTGRRPLLTATALAATAAVTVAVIAAVADPSPLHPREASLLYVWDEPAGSGHWSSIDLDPAPAVRRLLPEGTPLTEKPELFEGYPLEVFYADAPAAEIPAPVVTLEGASEGEDGTRRLRLRVRSRRPAGHLNVELDGPAGLRVTAVDGVDLEAPAEEPDFYTVRFLGTDPDGHEVELALPVAGEVTYNAVDRTYDLPPSLAGAAEPLGEATALLPMTLARSSGRFAADAAPENGTGEATAEEAAGAQAGDSESTAPSRER